MDNEIIIVLFVSAVSLFPLLLIVLAVRVNKRNMESAGKQSGRASSATSGFSKADLDFLNERPSDEGQATVKNLHRGTNHPKQTPIVEQEEELTELEENKSAERIRELMADDVRSVMIASELLQRRY